jgi:mRNA export factor
VYAVNDISFHQGYGTFSTAGSDGTINFWDKDARSRIKRALLQPAANVDGLTYPMGCTAEFDPVPGPITATAFNRTGTIFAYAVSYDWSKGHGGMTQGHINKIMLHPCKDEEVKKRPKK